MNTDECETCGTYVCDPVAGCWAGQNCIVLRRRNGGPVHEDYVFTQAGIARRACCTEDYTEEQAQALQKAIEQVGGAAYLVQTGDTVLVIPADAPPCEKSGSPAEKEMGGGEIRGTPSADPRLTCPGRQHSGK